jgi:predicted ATPase
MVSMTPPHDLHDLGRPTVCDRNMGVTTLNKRASTARSGGHHHTGHSAPPASRIAGGVPQWAVSRPLIARSREMKEVLGAVGAGLGIVLSGASGVGKTAFAMAVAETMQATGARVERIVATAASRSMPFGALAPLLPEQKALVDPALLAAAIRRRAEASNGRRPALLVVDDAHLLDDHSAATVQLLATTGSAQVVATLRTGHPAPDAVHALWKDGFAAHHEVAPFDRAATHELLVALLGGDVAVGTATLLWRQTGGNALYLTELVRHARTQHQLIDERGVWMWRGALTVPPRLADLLHRRFDGLSDDALDAVAALVLGEPLALTTLRAVAASDGIETLEDRELVVDIEHDGAVSYRFAHPMLAAVASTRLTRTRRCRIAQALLDEPATGGSL